MCQTNIPAAAVSDEEGGSLLGLPETTQPSHGEGMGEGEAQPQGGVRRGHPASGRASPQAEAS